MHHPLFAYRKSLDGVTAIVLMNFGAAELSLEGVLTSSDAPASEYRLVLSNYRQTDSAVETLPDVLRGWEGCVYISASAEQK